jgi:hypothetical protein
VRCNAGTPPVLEMGISGRKKNFSIWTRLPIMKCNEISYEKIVTPRSTQTMLSTPLHLTISDKILTWKIYDQIYLLKSNVLDINWVFEYHYVLYTQK